MALLYLWEDGLSNLAEPQMHSVELNELLGLNKEVLEAFTRVL